MKYTMAEPLPFDHQLQGVREIVGAGGKLALLCDPGTGKTRMVIDYLGLMASNFDRPVRVLIIAPVSVTDSWLKEFEKWMGPEVGFVARVLQGNISEKHAQLAGGPSDATPQVGICVRREGIAGSVECSVTNIEVLSSRRAKSGPRGGKLNDAELLLKAVKAWKPDVLVCDESHRLKGSSSNAARMAARLAMAIPRRLLLTGTPMPHGPLDVWSQWRILDPEAFATTMPDGQIESWNYTQFKDYYCLVNGYQIIGYRNLDDMQKRMEPRSFVVHKEDCLDLPPVTQIDVPFALSPSERTAYRNMKRDMQVLFSDNSEMTAQNKLAQMMRLRQVACGFVTDDDGSRYEIGTSRLDACTELLEDIMAGENRCVIFAWSRWECEKLYEKLHKNPIHGAVPMLITGDTTEAQRLAHRTTFGSDSGEKLILIAQARTISLGVNELVSSAYGIFLSLTQQRDDLVQAMARLDRQGQKRPVSLYFLVGRGTIDEVILRSHRDKTDLETAVLTHLKEA